MQTVDPSLIDQFLNNNIFFCYSWYNCFFLRIGCLFQINARRARCHSNITQSPRNPPNVSIPTSTIEEVLVITNDWWNSSPKANSATTNNEYEAQRNGFWILFSLLNARKSKSPRRKYSVTWANFRMMPWTWWRVLSEIVGIKNRSSGSMILEVFEDEKVPLDIQNVKPTQRTTGNQYVKNIL